MSMVRRVLDDMGREFLTPPYRLLPLAVFAFAVLCFILHPNGAVRTGMLADTDDYMRLNETINWLQGQGWYDLSHPRLSPGSHTVVHWARLLDLSIALLMLPLIKFVGVQNAALFASFIVPPATFGVLLWLAAALAKPFVGSERANLATLMVLFAPLVMLNFVPGRVDHHGYEILVAGFGLLCLERIIEDDRYGARYAVAAAIVFACGLWIGTEALPWVILFTGCLAVSATLLGETVLRRAVLFGLAFVIATAIVFLLAVAPADYRSLALSWFSFADVVFAGLVAWLFGGAWLVGRIVKKQGLRLACIAMLGITAAALFVAIVPDALQGPFADYDDYDSTIALASIGEAKPLIQGLQLSLHNFSQTGAALLGMLQLLVLPVVALIAVVHAILRAKLQRRMILVSQGVFLTVSLVLTLFWQMRVGWFMEFFALAPLTYLLVTGWKSVAKRTKGYARFWGQTGVFVALGLLPTVLIPAAVHDSPFYSDVVLFPAQRPAQACPLRKAADFLTAPWGYGMQTHTILSGANEGPELLFRTSHNVIAANFNVEGNQDVYNFFGARDDKTARAILKRWHADLVLVCRNIPPAYARMDHIQLGHNAFITVTKDGSLSLISDPRHPTLIERLTRGTIPAWLKPVEIPGDKDYQLFEIVSR